MLSLLVATIFVLIVIFGRLAYIQVVWGKQLQAQAADQWTRDIPLEAKRGDIADINGRVLATSVGTYDVYLRPKSIKDADQVAFELSKILSMDYNTVYEKATKKNTSEVTLVRQIDANTASQIRELDLSGVYLGAQYQRQYVYGDFLSQVLGYLTIDNIGQSGIEAYYDKYLAGDLMNYELSDQEIQKNLDEIDQL